MTNVLRILSVVMFFSLAACGGDDSDSMSESMDASAKTFMHDQDVIYQDEIYAGWPYN